MDPKSNHLIWIDLEMTGLDTTRDYIIEIATIVTDSELNIIAEGPELAIFQAEELLLQMDAWNTRQHNRSGLTERVRQSAVNEAQVEKLTLEFLSQYVIPGRSPMCGNSICQDRRFLHRHMPKLEQFFHYRHIDVSTVKELAKHWLPKIVKGFKKESKHRAMDDIKESINELKYYREHFFIKPELE